MAQSVAEQRQSSVVIREFLEARTPELRKALPSHIKPEHFQRAALTAIANNPQLENVELRSLWNSLIKCAQDGLIPDGREAILIVYGSKAQYQQMIGGLRKLVLQSGEVLRFDQALVYQNDEFDPNLGTRPYFKHKLALKDRGPVIAVYSVAEFRNRTWSHELMSFDDVEHIRLKFSRNPNAGPWRDSWGEMAIKTVARRHAKRLPMSSDVATAISRDEDKDFYEDEDFDEPTAPLQATGIAPPRQASQPAAAAVSPRLAQQLPPASEEPRPSAPATEPPKRGRGRLTQCQQCGAMRPSGEACPNCGYHPQPGRPKKSPAPAADNPGHEFAGDADPVFDEVDETTGEIIEPPDPREEPNYDGPPERIENVVDDTAPEPLSAANPDWQNGWRSARNGAKQCLNTDISNDPRRFRNWQAGFNAFLDEKAAEQKGKTTP